MNSTCLRSYLSSAQLAIVEAIEKHAVTLLDHSPRFKYFTLHGKEHIANLYKIIDILCQSGLKFNQDQAFLLCCSICVHDLGMVIPLRDFNPSDIFRQPQPSDPANMELLIRNAHHELIDNYIENHFDFLLSMGVTPPQCALIRDISRCHRKIDIDKTQGFVRSIGAILRVIDELDIYASRAPAAVLLDHYEEMDSTSCWHWLKHNLCADWMIGHNVVIENAAPVKVTFFISVHPPRSSSIPYWLTQIRRPIQRVLYDEGSARSIIETWNVNISIQHSQELSSPIQLGEAWNRVHDKALSSGQKIIIVIDDEVRKLEDLFLPLMLNYYVIFAQNAKDGLDKLAATKIDLAIVDLQIGSGFQWSAEETQDYKMTGVKLCKEIAEKFPKTKLGILTGSRHDISIAKELNNLEFLLKKPVDPDFFEKEVTRVLT
jgi:hypothetical protein